MSTEDAAELTLDPPEPSPLRCPLCGKSLVERQCKRLCENCGYVESCEDLFGPQGSSA